MGDELAEQKSLQQLAREVGDGLDLESLMEERPSCLGWSLCDWNCSYPFTFIY